MALVRDRADVLLKKAEADELNELLAQASGEVRTVEDLEAAFTRFAQGGRPAVIDAIQERPAR